ncbi:TetR/AcrR family transcriptional regulator [Litoribrevibacter albus]|uniref:TetR family transcriptional regulator n=1 Tax=Litoribrevibacter albus TaxID=1473156 RepID=A0AA37W6K2_9GAMM|nr:TetR/AcrR family transcriptional regulator [Litoribrevibacter albus]GLQ32172.1 TetR family transcriptional regulator [Litoribrevibacter albus]
MKESTTPRVTLRKKPTQARSIQKYNRILDMVAELVESGGTDWITTNLIAEKVGVPIGTIYQFFPNKESILYALFERQLHQLDTHFEPFFSEALDELSMDQLMGQAVFSMSTAYEKVPGMVNIMNSMHVHPDFRELVDINNRRLAKWLSGLLKRRFPDESDDQLMLVAEAVVELGDSIFRKLLQLRPRDELREMMLIGFKLAVIALVDQRLGS